MTKKQDMELELSRLKEENKTLQAKEEDRINDKNNTFFAELRKIQKVGEKTQGNITYKDIHHPTVALWRQDGKMIGPLHPSNAEVTFKRFYDVGVLLSTRKPTLDEIERYKQTDEYKKIEQAYRTRRSTRNRSKKSDEIQKLAEVLKNNLGVRESDINSIRKKEEVGV